MKRTALTLIVALIGTSAMAFEGTPKSPNPAISPDGFGQLVGERGENNTESDERYVPGSNVVAFSAPADVTPLYGENLTRWEEGGEYISGCPAGFVIEGGDAYTGDPAYGDCDGR